MIARQLQQFFYFGTSVRFLQDARSGYVIADSEHGRGIRANLRMLFEQLETLQLQVSARTRAAEVLKALLGEVEDLEGTLSQAQASRLSMWMTELRTTLEAELKGFHAYTTTPKRLDIDKLINAPSSLMAPDVYASLPEIAQYDLSEAGKCIAFERPTAAAFHLMRATEGVLRQFYLSRVKRNRVELMWGPIVRELRLRKSIKIPQVLLDHLDNIRRSFRNPTQHPEAVYSIEEVQDLWSLCIDVVNRMARLGLS